MLCTRPRGDPIIEDVAQQFDHAAGRTMADQHQAQDQLPHPSLGDRQIEEDVVACGCGSEGLVEGRFGGMDLLIEELPARPRVAEPTRRPFPSRRAPEWPGLASAEAAVAWRDRKHPEVAGEGQPGPMPRVEVKSRLRDRELRSSLTNHVCFLRETGFVAA